MIKKIWNKFFGKKIEKNNMHKNVQYDPRVLEMLKNIGKK